MKILSINNQQNQTTYKAVNPKYFKQAKATYARYAPYQNQGHLLTMLKLEVAYNLLSLEDAIDTLEAIKPFSDDAIELINNLINTFKKMMSNQ